VTGPRRPDPLGGELRPDRRSAWRIERQRVRRPIGESHHYRVRARLTHACRQIVQLVDAVVSAVLAPPPPSYRDVVSGVPPPPIAEEAAETYDWVDVHGLLDENLDLLDGSPGL
jgi:hypothetical protein